MSGLRIGIADHFGWAVVVAATAGHDVVDRRRVELVEPGLSPAPVHYEARRLDDRELAALVAEVRVSIARVSAAAFDELASALPAPVESVLLRKVPHDFPTAIEVLRTSPYEARADAVMYRQVLAEVARARGWAVCSYAAKDVVARATALLGARADDVLHGPRARLGPPWTKDHRVALAATIVLG